MSSKYNLQKEEMRRRILGGARLQMGRLSEEELQALHPMLVAGEAEVISENCTPVAVLKLARW